MEKRGIIGNVITRLVFEIFAIFFIYVGVGWLLTIIATATWSMGGLHLLDNEQLEKMVEGTVAFLIGINFGYKFSDKDSIQDGVPVEIIVKRKKIYCIINLIIWAGAILYWIKTNSYLCFTCAIIICWLLYLIFKSNRMKVTRDDDNNKNVINIKDTCEEIDNADKENYPKYRYCRKCGAEITEGSRFCSKCGEKIFEEK